MSGWNHHELEKEVKDYKAKYEKNADPAKLKALDESLNTAKKNLSNTKVSMNKIRAQFASLKIARAAGTLLDIGEIAVAGKELYDAIMASDGEVLKAAGDLALKVGGLIPLGQAVSGVVDIGKNANRMWIMSKEIGSNYSGIVESIAEQYDRQLTTLEDMVENSRSNEDIDKRIALFVEFRKGMIETLQFVKKEARGTTVKMPVIRGFGIEYVEVPLVPFHGRADVLAKMDELIALLSDGNIAAEQRQFVKEMQTELEERNNTIRGIEEIAEQANRNSAAASETANAFAEMMAEIESAEENSVDHVYLSLDDMAEQEEKNIYELLEAMSEEDRLYYIEQWAEKDKRIKDIVDDIYRKFKAEETRMREANFYERTLARTDVDIFFLADNTGSMGGVIDSVNKNAQAILDGLRKDIDGGDSRFDTGKKRSTRVLVWGVIWATRANMAKRPPARMN